MESSWATMTEPLDYESESETLDMEIDEDVSKQVNNLNITREKECFEPVPINNVIGVVALSDYGETFYFRTLHHHFHGACKDDWIPKFIETLKQLNVRELIVVGRRIQSMLEREIPSEIYIYYDPKDNLQFRCSCCLEIGCPFTKARLALRRFLKYCDYKVDHKYQKPEVGREQM
ncbi:hypothetical protein HNY73_011279 [Argiope bruennichi]|uniref:Uncharacterized protein n=1 Tax=Argiope bruennichi TaxID=94029 RepID=A0A8T0F3M0_ARGBR|nr:hypothetical protein HNY73_011279 [Argiope bruennichi]